MPMSRRFAWLAILPWILAASANAQTPFDRFDVNKDGKVTRNEVPERLRERFDAIDANKDGSITPEEQRSYLRPTSAQGATDVKVEKDIPYASTKNPRQTLDLLLPVKPTDAKPLPVVVYIHGGAWQSGDKTQGIGPIMALTASGDYAAASIGYRLTDEASWPAQAFDCKAAIRWIRANAAKYHLDPDRIGLIGPSAGGHLVAMLGTSGDVESLEGDLGPYKGVSSRVSCVVDEFGPSDLATMMNEPSSTDHKSAKAPESKLVGGAILEKLEVSKAASPITYVSKDDPPFLIIHGDKDPIVPFNQSVKLAKALKETGVDVRFIKVEGGSHGGFQNPELPRRTRQFLDKYLRGKDVGTISEEPVPSRLATPKR
jgi:acetyl esterase/lipase